MTIYTIYRAKNVLNEKCYVGFDSRWPNRKGGHLRAVRSNSTQALYRAMRKHGVENFVWEVIYQSKDRDHTLNEMERYFISEFNSFNNGYNMTLGGEGIFGRKNHCQPHSEEAKQKMKDAWIRRKARGDVNIWKGRKHSKESRDKMSRSASSGNRQSEQFRRACVERNRKRYLTPESRQQASEAVRKGWETRRKNVN
jgi:group I intron endonuclease